MMYILFFQVKEKKEDVKVGEKDMDTREYRPLNVILDITVHDLQVGEICFPSFPSRCFKMKVKGQVEGWVILRIFL